MSPAPMSRPSSTNTTPLIGWSTATQSSRNAGERGHGGVVGEQLGQPRPQHQHDHAEHDAGADAPLDHAPARGPGLGRRARAPRKRPIIAWPAMARASSTRARKLQISKAIWWAATSTVPMRVATAVASSSDPRSAAVRRNRSRPTTASRPQRAAVRAERHLVAAHGPGDPPHVDRRPRSTGR